jgi:hypothetical protein
MVARPGAADEQGPTLPARAGTQEPWAAQVGTRQPWAAQVDTRQPREAQVGTRQPREARVGTRERRAAVEARVGVVAPWAARRVRWRC